MSSYFNDCFDALTSLIVANLNNNIATAFTECGLQAWVPVDFGANNGHFITEDVEPIDVQLDTELSFPVISLYPDTSQNNTDMMGQSFSGPVNFCMDYHMGSESNDQLFLVRSRMAVAEAFYATFDGFDPAIRTNWIAHQVAYSRGLKMKMGKSTLFGSNQFMDYSGCDIWLLKISFQATFNLIRK